MPEPLLPGGSSRCSVVEASPVAVDAAVRSSSSRRVVCLAAGTYPGLDLGGMHNRNVIVQPSPGQNVTLTPGVTGGDGAVTSVHIQPGASHIVVHGFKITGGVQLEAGDSFVRIDHNDITGLSFGIWLNSTDCRAPNAPTWANCAPDPKISDVTISGNRIHDITNGADAMDIDNFARVRVTGNEIVGIVDQGGQHVDCLQSVFGGSHLVFDHNYEHDNNCQGFFTKDGDVTDVLLYDNLFLRDQIHSVSEQNIDIVNVYNLVMRRNTSLPGTGDMLRDIGSARPTYATVDHNLFGSLSNGCCGDQAHPVLTQRANIFEQVPWTFRIARREWKRRPRFIDPSTDDYRLAKNPRSIGIDWAPEQQQYGP